MDDDYDFDWEEEFGWETEDSWNLYGLQVSSIITGEPLTGLWPVYAADYEAAINTFQILLQLRENKR